MTSEADPSPGNSAESKPDRRLKLVLEYDGTGYCGWQLQPNGPTIQGCLEACLERVLGAPHRVHGAGRTDAGVHARGQVAHLSTTHAIPPLELQRALNALLPRDIAVWQLSEVPCSFHARYSRHQKRYVYQILNRAHRSVFMDPYAWHIRHALDLEAMAEAAKCLEGVHDFSAFRAADCGARHAVRDVRAVRVVDRGEGLICLEVEGNGFLKHMVRTMVGTLVEVGRGRRTVEDVAQVVEGRDRRRAGKTSPAQGLWLEWVHYEGGDDGWEEPVLDDATGDDPGE